MRGYDAVATDVYLDGLLARRGGASPSVLPADEAPERSIRATADLLDRALPRFHPSFRFEERLASRLRAAAAGLGSTEPPGELVAFPGLIPAEGASQATGERRARGLLVGGAIASGVSIAGAALAGSRLRAWRRGRAPTVAGVSSERAV